MKKAHLILLFCLTACYGKSPTKTGLEGKPAPAFDLLLTDSISHFNTSNISEGQPFVLFFFGTHCPYSRAEMESIIQITKTYPNLQFYIFTTDPIPDLKEFSDFYQLKKYNTILAGQDFTYFFARYFSTNIVPYMAIYDTKKRLKQVLIGMTSIKQIKNVLNEE